MQRFTYPLHVVGLQFSEFVDSEFRIIRTEGSKGTVQLSEGNAAFPKCFGKRIISLPFDAATDLLWRQRPKSRTVKVGFGGKSTPVILHTVRI